jgi:hypothetical protein
MRLWPKANDPIGSAQIDPAIRHHLLKQQIRVIVLGHVNRFDVVTGLPQNQCQPVYNVSRASMEEWHKRRTQSDSHAQLPRAELEVASILTALIAVAVDEPQVHCLSVLRVCAKLKSGKREGKALGTCSRSTHSKLSKDIDRRSNRMAQRGGRD